MTIKKSLIYSNLGPDYESFRTSMLKPPIPPYSELVPLLYIHETMRSLHSQQGLDPNVSFYRQRSQGQNNKRNGNKKGKYVNQGNQNNSQRNFPSKGRGFT